ncbi:hypothetical protein F511_31170 [Dorcoceras hygrometricum]|uniref:Uncharacterized protein n=1 Tax=Dorcoceras hygrometricum TaxID=472368 RepID=A0A2Z7BDZ8_9LAMI|nr:hypothetical protein F511_31170 [Dorcoceras hygrometricum]
MTSQANQILALNGNRSHAKSNRSKRSNSTHKTTSLTKQIPALCCSRAQLQNDGVARADLSSQQNASAHQMSTILVDQHAKAAYIIKSHRATTDNGRYQISLKTTPFYLLLEADTRYYTRDQISITIRTIHFIFDQISPSKYKLKSGQFQLEI